MNKREMILAEAEQIFMEKGYYGLSLSELLGRCRIPKGSFYYYFPGGKIQLIQETLEYGYSEMVNGIERRIFVEDTALGCFERMATHLADGIGTRRRYASLFLTMISIESVHLDARINETCRRIYDEWQAYYADHLRRFGFDERESVEKAQAVFALIHGSIISSWIKQDPSDLYLAKNTLRSILGDR